jgi:hypothetical protein
LKIVQTLEYLLAEMALHFVAGCVPVRISTMKSKNQVARNSRGDIRAIRERRYPAAGRIPDLGARSTGREEKEKRFPGSLETSGEKK